MKAKILQSTSSIYKALQSLRDISFEETLGSARTEAHTFLFLLNLSSG